MDFKEANEKLKGNPELAMSLEEALRRKAGAEELAAILEGAGLDASAAEALVAEYQRRVGAAIADEEVDEGTLTRVAGGSNEDCNEGFFNLCGLLPDHDHDSNTCSNIFDRDLDSCLGLLNDDC